MATDPLSAILRLTEATSVMTGGITASGKWALRFPPPGEIKFSLLVQGTCYLRLDGHRKAIRGEPGDVVLMPGRRGFIVGSDLSAVPLQAPEFFARKHGQLATIGEGGECIVFAGGVTLEPSNADLLQAALPPLIHLRGSAPQAAGVRWIVEQLLAEELGTSPGGAVASAALAQLLFVQVLRAYLATGPRLPAGWLRAMSDERLAPAMRLMIEQPARAWKLEELARASAMSRTAFAVHFRKTAAVAPLQYLTEWRMRLAQRRLRRDASAISEIASAVGYSSESAFSQAFKRVMGRPPRDFRREARLSNRSA